MKLSAVAKQRWLVALCFGAFMGLCLLVAWLLGMLPSFEQKCTQECKARGLNGRMEYVLPEVMTRGSRGRGPRKCECFRWGEDPHPDR
jgi:hypothetical protein